MTRLLTAVAALVFLVLNSAAQVFDGHTLPPMPGLTAILSNQQEATPAGTLAGSKLGVNIGGVCDWCDEEMMFVNVLMDGRGFGLPSAPWNPAGYSSTGQSPALDAHGWPTADFGVFLLSVTSPQNYGIYHFQFNGRATVQVFGGQGGNVNNVVYDAATNTTTGQVTVSASDTAPGLALNFVNTTGGVQNLEILRPGYPLGTTQVFTNEFLKAIAPFGTLRFMDTLATNGNPVTSWAQRTPPGYIFQGNYLPSRGNRGIAWEYIIQLANASGKDIWINIPLQVDLTDPTPNNYVTQLATLLRSTLKPGIHVYVEYSNEVWNYIFPQAQINYCTAIYEVTGKYHSGCAANGQGYVNGTFTGWPIVKEANPTNSNRISEYVAADGTLQPDANQWDWATNRHAQQVVLISNLFRNVYGAAAINNTIRVVYADQFVACCSSQLAWINANFGPPNQYIYGIAGAPYFSLPQTQNYGTPSHLLQALAAGENHILSYFSGETSFDVTNIYGQYNLKDQATYYGLKVIAYEGGPDVTEENDPTLQVQALADPQLNNMVQWELADWIGCGNDLFMYYTLATAPGDVWGAYNDLSQPTPRSIALNTVAATPLSSYNNCMVYNVPSYRHN